MVLSVLIPGISGRNCKLNSSISLIFKASPRRDMFRTIPPKAPIVSSQLNIAVETSNTLDTNKMSLETNTCPTVAAL